MNSLAALSLNPAQLKPLHAAPPRGLDGSSSQNSVEQAQELKQNFSQFFGEMFFGQMIKSMRTSVGEPAYFHGGRAEEIFQGQLDQKLAEEMTAASADRLADPMFAQAFPRAAETLQKHEAKASPKPQLSDLLQLQPR